MNNNEVRQAYKDAAGGSFKTDDNWVNFLQSFGRMEGKIDQVIAGQETMKIKQEEHEARLRVVETGKDEDHENRIRILEKGAWKQAGIVGLFATVGVFFIGPFVDFLSNL